MSSLFSKIVSGEIPAHIIQESSDFLAFLDINPLAEGHTLVIPKKETDYIFDMGDEEYMKLWEFAKSVALKVEKAIECKRIGIAVIGLEVAHAHIHLVPINSVSDINFAQPKLNLSQEELARVAAKING